VRAAHDPHTVARALAISPPGEAHRIVAAFVTGADAGFRAVGVTVLVLGALVVGQSLLSRRGRAGRTAPDGRR
jgi:hypothetical protein